MTMINDIQNALNSRLNGVTGLPTVAWPNVEFTPTQGTNYVRPTLLPASNVLNALDGDEECKGIYQIDVYTQLKKGTSPLWTIADAIRDHFKNSNSITSGSQVVHIQQVSVSQADRQEGFWHCFVAVTYLAYN